MQSETISRDADKPQEFSYENALETGFFRETGFLQSKFAQWNDRLEDDKGKLETIS